MSDAGDVDAITNYLSQEDEMSLEADALLVACELSEVNRALEIIKLKPEFAWGKNKHGYSPLHFSCENGLVPVVEALVELDLKLCQMQDNYSRTPLHLAAMAGKEDVIRVLAKKCPASLEGVTSSQETALHLALKHNQSGSFEVLVEELQKHNHAEILNWKDHEGNTVLHIASSHKQVKVLELLLQHINGLVIQVNSQNRKELTALDLHHQNYYPNRVDKYTSHLHEAGAKEGCDLDSFGGQPSHSQSSILSESPKFTKMTIKSLLLAVFIFIAGAIYTSLFSLPTIYPLEDHIEFTLSVKDLISGSGQLPDVFYYVVLNTATYLVSMIVILEITWSVDSKWSLYFRAVPLFLMITMSISYAIIVKKIVPKFWVTIGTYKFSSFWVVWLSVLPLILSLVMMWLMVKTILCSVSKRKSGAYNTGDNHQ